MIDGKMPDNLPQWMKDHVARYLKSGGTDGHMYTASFPGKPTLTVPSLLLVTKGRKTGARHLFPLFYGETGKSYFIVASKGGAPDHPGWYKNILANPDVELQVGTRTLKARARTVSGAERSKLWNDAVKWWPAYADYQKKTEREIPIVVLDPL
ncbi:MAG TPA: nitroreductase family deazaflavin-dependent oxidoreductase [Reyranella sp.]|jgi:proline iminopeptidase|nr:nitroreductase family deazaflavin-dependent oxidoreductase [Reyranella sp.]